MSKALQRESLVRGLDIMVKNVVQQCRQDKIFNFINYTLLSLLFLLIIYPLIFVISCSFSSGPSLMAGMVKLWPVDPSFLCYKTVFAYTPIWTGYANSLFYMIVGTFVNLVLTICAAYPLSRKEIKGKKFLNWFFLFTMLFNGGLVPNYLLVKNLGLINTRWAIVLTGAMNVYNVIVERSDYQQLS